MIITKKHKSLISHEITKKTRAEIKKETKDLLPKTYVSVHLRFCLFSGAYSLFSSHKVDLQSFSAYF